MILFFPSEASFTQENKGHGRYEKRIYKASTDLPDDILENWAGAYTAIQITRERIVKKKISTETVFILTSLNVFTTGLEEIASLIRGHWGIENKVHWVRDVTLGEDLCQASKGNSAQNRAVFRNILLNLFRLHGVENIAKEQRQIQFQQGSWKKYFSEDGNWEN